MLALVSQPDSIFLIVQDSLRTFSHRTFEFQDSVGYRIFELQTQIGDLPAVYGTGVTVVSIVVGLFAVILAIISAIGFIRMDSTIKDTALLRIDVDSALSSVDDLVETTDKKVLALSKRHDLLLTTTQQNISENKTEISNLVRDTNDRLNDQLATQSKEIKETLSAVKRDVINLQYRTHMISVRTAKNIASAVMHLKSAAELVGELDDHSGKIDSILYNWEESINNSTAKPGSLFWEFYKQLADEIPKVLQDLTLDDKQTTRMENIIRSYNLKLRPTGTTDE